MVSGQSVEKKRRGSKTNTVLVWPNNPGVNYFIKHYPCGQNNRRAVVTPMYSAFSFPLN